MACWHAGYAFYPQFEVLVFSGFDLIKPYSRKVKLEQGDRCSPYQSCQRHLEAHLSGVQRNRAQEESWSPGDVSKLAQTKGPVCPGQLTHMGIRHPGQPYPIPYDQFHFITYRLIWLVIQLENMQGPRRWRNHIVFKIDFADITRPWKRHVFKGPTPSPLQKRRSSTSPVSSLTLL